MNNKPERETKPAESIESAESNEPVPYIAFESALARQDSHIRHLFIALIVAISLIFVTNGIWLLAWMQFDYVSDTYTVESNDGGNANYIGNDGDIHNGENSNQESVENAENQQQP